jgi:hypothetical protein
MRQRLGRVGPDKVVRDHHCANNFVGTHIPVLDRAAIRLYVEALTFSSIAVSLENGSRRLEPEH